MGEYLTVPNYSHTLEVNATPDQIFAVLDDVSQTPRWLGRCTGIDKLSEGPNAVGTKLRYHYKQGGRAGAMEGEIVAREPGRRISMAYSDKITDVTVDFAATPVGTERTSLTHTITITTKGIGKLFGPLISRQLPGQTIGAMTKLKTLVEKS